MDRPDGTGRRAVLATAGAALAAGSAGCLGGPLGDLVAGLGRDDFDVGMSANAFLPDRLEVAPGETVVWGNNGSRGHTVTAYDDALPDGADFFASGGATSTAAAREAWRRDGTGTLSPGETFSHTFEVGGRYHYFCVPHEKGGMTGVVVVAE